MSEISSKPELILMPDGLNYIITKLDGETRLFCPETGQFYKKGRFNKKQKRHYLRLRAGFELAFSRHERINFLTLSTQYDLLLDDNGFPIIDRNGKHIAKYPREVQLKRKGLNKAFTKLKQMIERKITTILYERWCKKRSAEPYIYVGNFKKKKVRFPTIFKKFTYKMRYFKLKTLEGGGVLHIVFRKGWNIPSIPYEWLRHAWLKIWGAKNGVNIKGIDITDVKGLSMYLVGQYFAKQPVIRMSCGYFWIGQRVKKRFNDLINAYGYKKALDRWRLMYQSDCIPTGVMGYQKRLRYKLLPSVEFRKYLKPELINRQKLPKKTYIQLKMWSDCFGHFCCGRDNTSYIIKGG